MVTSNMLPRLETSPTTPIDICRRLPSVYGYLSVFVLAYSSLWTDTALARCAVEQGVSRRCMLRKSVLAVVRESSDPWRLHILEREQVTMT